jgi:hypothetical protein
MVERAPDGHARGRHDLAVADDRAFHDLTDE